MKSLKDVKSLLGREGRAVLSKRVAEMGLLWLPKVPGSQSLSLIYQKER